MAERNNKKEKTHSELWKWAAVSLFGVLAGGTPNYMFDLQKRPTRQEVSLMIAKEAPSTVYSELRDISTIQKTVQIQQAKFSATLESLLYEIKRKR